MSHITIDPEFVLQRVEAAKQKYLKENEEAFKEARQNQLLLICKENNTFLRQLFGKPYTMEMAEAERSSSRLNFVYYPNTLRFDSLKSVAEIAKENSVQITITEQDAWVFASALA